MDQALPMVVELNQKIDLLTTQVQFLTEQAQRAERERQERAELMRDVMPIVNDAFRLTVDELEEVQEYVDLGDLLRLLKRLLRNGRNIDKMLDQLESVMDLAQTVGPLTDSAFEKATDLLQTAEHKGYFGFAKGGMQIIDNVITSFNEEDVMRLGDNVVLILNVVKDMTQPEIMSLVRNIVSGVEDEVARPVSTSLPALLGQMRDPNVRRGLALTHAGVAGGGRAIGGGEVATRGRGTRGRWTRRHGTRNQPNTQHATRNTQHAIRSTNHQEKHHGNQSYRRQDRSGQRRRISDQPGGVDEGNGAGDRQGRGHRRADRQSLEGHRLLPRRIQGSRRQVRYAAPDHHRHGHLNQGAVRVVPEGPGQEGRAHRGAGEAGRLRVVRIAGAGPAPALHSVPRR